MKILICNDYIYMGGVETILHCTVDWFAKKGYDVTVMACPPEPKTFRKAFPKGVHRILSRWPRKQYKRFSIPFFFNYLARIIYRAFFSIFIHFRKYDVCVALKEGFPALDCLKVRAKKKYAFIHCDLRDFTEFITYVFGSLSNAKVCMMKYDKVICVSDTAKTGFIETIGDTQNLCIKHNPINYKRIIELSKTTCKYQKAPSHFLIVAVGRLTPKKNFLTLLESCKLLKDKSNFDLWIIGDGSQRAQLEDYIKVNQLNNVSLLGFQNNPYPMIMQADLFVSSSVSESYGLAVQEALIFQVPVIAVKCPGIIESFDTRFGVLVDNSANALANTIADFINDPSLSASYRESIRLNFKPSSLYGDRLEDICKLWEPLHQKHKKEL